MCGITGFFSYKNRVDTKEYYDAHKKIAHRGPDDEGFIYRDNDLLIKHLIGDDTINEFHNRGLIYQQESSSLILGHRRLSIIDLSAHGHQPFSFEGLYMVYNGEIYNYIELRDELKVLGYSFETNSDTEVFLKAYHCWGVDAFNKFNGMWSAAVYDASKDTILLTRDRFGIKPLYYSLIDNNLVFGSEIKFVASFFTKLKANEQMVYEYLRFSHTGHTDKTMFQNIFQLEPNSYMLFSNEGVEIKKYWDLSVVNNPREDRIEERLNRAISLRMRSDVEVGSLLSGGIDSSTILGIINQKKYANRFQTFSAVFDEEVFSEKKYIDKFETENLDLTKHFIYPKAEALSSHIDELLYIQEEPFRSLAVFSQYEIYKYIKENTDTVVLLNGQGADEIFTGYSKYYYLYLWELLRTLKLRLFIKELKAFSKNSNLSSLKLFKRLFTTVLSPYLQQSDKYGIFTKKFQVKKEPKKFSDRLKNSLWSGLTFSALREYLRYEDKNSMRFSLESRLPFLDYRLVEDAFSLNNGDRIKDGVSKSLLRTIAKGKIPQQTLDRKDKMGFVSPQEVWQRSILRDDFETVFKEIQRGNIFQFIDGQKVYTLFEEYQKNNFSDWAFIWRIYCLYKWKEVWGIDEK